METTLCIPPKGPPSYDTVITNGLTNEVRTNRRHRRLQVSMQKDVILISVKWYSHGFFAVATQAKKEWCDFILHTASE